jgi:hypothetical protein
MSNLRKIMQRLAESQERGMLNRAYDKQQFSEMVKYLVDEYISKLEECTPAMLQYEWCWLQEHIETLELCLAHPAMCEEIGGLARARELLEESRGFQQALEDVFRRRMIHPMNAAHPVVANEHAWEISQESIKKDWGIK